MSVHPLGSYHPASPTHIHAHGYAALLLLAAHLNELDIVLEIVASLLLALVNLDVALVLATTLRAIKVNSAAGYSGVDLEVGTESLGRRRETGTGAATGLSLNGTAAALPALLVGVVEDQGPVVIVGAGFDGAVDNGEVVNGDLFRGVDDIGVRSGVTGWQDGGVGEAQEGEEDVRCLSNNQSADTLGEDFGLPAFMLGCSKRWLTKR